MKKSINKSLFTKLAVVVLFFSLLHGSIAQINSIGTPFIKNYNKADYNAGQQNWKIHQGPDGRLYFANNEGILEFDGLNWTLHRLPKRIIARSLFVSEDGRIYAGGFNEFGYFKPAHSKHVCQ